MYMSKSILQNRDVLHISESELLKTKVEGFHVNSSWTIPCSHSVSVEEIIVSQACAVVNR